MDVSRSTEIRVGLVSIISIALLVAGIMLGKGISFSPSTKQVVIRLATSGGLEPGSPVVVNGVRRGTVSEISNSNGAVAVRATLSDVSDLREDVSALVTILEITGGKKVELTPGTSPTPYNPSNEIPGTVAADLGGLVTSLGTVSGAAVNLVLRLDTISAALTDLLRDGTFAADVRTITSDGALLMKDAQMWFAANKQPLSQSIQDLRAITEQLRSSIDRNEPKVSMLIERANKILVDLDATMAKANGAITNADSLIVRINGVVQDVKSNKSLMNAVLYDEKLTGSLDSTLLTLRKLLREFGKNGVNVNVGIGHRP